eukprot:3583008-Amphidinium_carterae.1
MYDMAAHPAKLSGRCNANVAMPEMQMASKRNLHLHEAAFKLHPPHCLKVDQETQRANLSSRKRA